MAGPASEVSTSLVSAGCRSLGSWPATHLQRQAPGHTIVFPFKARHLDRPIFEISYHHLPRKSFLGEEKVVPVFLPPPSFGLCIPEVCISGAGIVTTTGSRLISGPSPQKIEEIRLGLALFPHHLIPVTWWGVFLKKRGGNSIKLINPWYYLATFSKSQINDNFSNRDLSSATKWNASFSR